MDALTFIVLALATWRISSFLVREDGPWMMFEKIRIKSGLQRLSPAYPGYAIPDKFFAQLLSCVWCTGVWVGVLWTVFYLFFPTISFCCALPFALSAMAICIDGRVVLK